MYQGMVAANDHGQSPDRERELQTRLKALLLTVNTVEELGFALRRRLEPLTTPHPIADEQDKNGTPQPSRSEFASELFQIEARLDVVAYVLQQLLGNLEI